MTNKEAIRQSIAHWERMRAWAKKQTDKGSKEYATKAGAPSRWFYPGGFLLFHMKHALGETWVGYYCALCYYSFCDGGGGCCDECPYALQYGSCNNPHAANAWKDVDNSSTWEEWIRNSDRVIEQLESLLGPPQRHEDYELEERRQGENSYSRQANADKEKPC